MPNRLDSLSFEARPSDSVAALPLGDVVREYLTLYADGATHTSRAKQLDTDRFLEFLRRRKKVSEIEHLLVHDWDFSGTQRFVDECLKQGEAPATVARRLATLKHMGRVLAERIPGFINPAREVKAPRQQPTRPKSISPTEVSEIRESVSSKTSENSSFKAIRDETLLTLLLDTGLRAEEIRTLIRSQLRDSLDYLERVRTKGRRFRDVYITSEMREPLQRYLAARTQELLRCFPTLSASVDSKLPLFISLYRVSIANPKSFEMGAKSVWRAIRKCSVRTKLHPHLLRHTYATELLEDSRDIRLVAQALGHSDVRVTMRYTERGNEEIAQALERTRKHSRSPKND
jgi:integrase/recombinase XerC